MLAVHQRLYNAEHDLAAARRDLHKLQNRDGTVRREALLRAALAEVCICWGCVQGGWGWGVVAAHMGLVGYTCSAQFGLDIVCVVVTVRVHASDCVCLAYM